MNKTVFHIKRKVEKTISRYGMIRPGDRVIVGVSGGPDSVCLLRILHELKVILQADLIVAHYNHGLRPGEDQRESRFVKNMAGELSVPFYEEAAIGLLEDGPQGLEERARNARYAFYLRVKIRTDAQKIALGHNLNDQAETVLMRLLRGSGSAGLSGIPPVRENGIIRPLIETSREEIEGFLRSLDIDFMSDSSNLRTDFLRNRIRLELLPRMMEYQPRLIHHLAGLADMMREENAYMIQEAREWIKGAAGERDEETTVPLPLFNRLPSPLKNRVVRELLGATGGLRRIDRGHVHAVVRLAESRRPQGALDLPRGMSVARRYDELVFGKAPGPGPRPFHHIINGPGSYTIAEIGCVISLKKLDRGRLPASFKSAGTIAYLDADKVRFPVVIRNYRPGDRFIPFGMKGRRKVKDFFIDLKIPSVERQRIPILASKDGPVWIGGYRLDERFRVTPETRTVLEVKISYP